MLQLQVSFQFDLVRLRQKNDLVRVRERSVHLVQSQQTWPKIVLTSESTNTQFLAVNCSNFLSRIPSFVSATTAGNGRKPKWKLSSCFLLTNIETASRDSGLSAVTTTTSPSTSWHDSQLACNLNLLSSDHTASDRAALKSLLIRCTRSYAGCSTSVNKHTHTHTFLIISHSN